MTDSNSDKESGEKCSILDSDRADTLDKDVANDEHEE